MTDGLRQESAASLGSLLKPLSPVRLGARVQAPLNMAILSYRENKVARFDNEKQRIVL